jgi:hypothetical protein
MGTSRMQPDYFNYRKEWFLPKQHNREISKTSGKPFSGDPSLHLCIK